MIQPPWTALMLAGALLVQATAAHAADFAYFLGDISGDNVANVPAGYAVLGEASLAQRNAYTAAGRIVGQSAALQNQSAASGFNLWPSIASLFAGPDAPSAADILDAALLYGYPSDDFPTASEGTPTSAGGYVVWAQDFEYNPAATGVSAAEVYAGVTAVLWAGRQALGDSVKIIPVPASSLFKGLNYDSAAMLSLISSLGLQAPPGHPDGGGEWNFLSLLYANHLIDGFLGQQYSINNADALPGSISSDTLPFSDAQTPYAIQSALYGPTQLTSTTIGGPPWESHYSGDMPFHAGVYWAGNTVDAAGNTTVTDKLTPTEQPLAAAVPEPAGSWPLALILPALAFLRSRRRARDGSWELRDLRAR
jgi:hypothetical protein